MKVVIVVRSSPDYKNLTNENFRAQLNQPYKPKTELNILISNGVLDIWNKTFRINYIYFRYQVHQIAKLSLQNTNCQIIWGYKEFVEWYTNNKEDCIIVPVDDDDWFSPEIIELPKCFESNENLVIWKKSILHSITTFRYEVIQEYNMGSNNWALKFSYLKSLPDTVARHLVLLSHKHSQEYFKHNLLKSKIKYVENYLSLHVRHPSSLSFIRQKIDEADFSKQLKQIASKKPILPLNNLDFEWAKNYIEKLQILSQQLREPVLKFI